MYAAGRASLAFLPSRWNVLTGTAFLFPKTTTASCSAYFNPEKNFITFPSCSALLWANTTLSLTHENTDSLHVNLPFLSYQPCWVESPGFCAGPTERLEKERAGCRAENRLCSLFFMLGRVKPVLPHRESQECEAGKDLVQAVPLCYGRFLSNLKNSSAKVPHISPWQLGPVFHLMLEALTWGYPVSSFARCSLFLTRKVACTDFWGLSAL